jgi:hypothetical protein
MDTSNIITLQNILEDMETIFKNVSQDKLINCIEWYASIRTRFTRDDIIDFIRVNIDLNNL